MTFEGASGPAASTAEMKPPLIVDMDGTILCSDTLIEGIAAGLFQKPVSTFLRLAAAPASRSRFKAWVFKNVQVDYEAIPINASLLEYLLAEKAKGRSLHLVSAADQGIVDLIAKNLDIFDSAMGSSASVNLKGKRKLAAIRETFGDSFVYVGDSQPDLEVWRHATGAIYAGTNATVERKLARSETTLEASFARKPASIVTWLQALRPHQWSKNLLLFVPLVLGQHYLELHQVRDVVLAFLILGLTASGTYLVNDLSDLGADRRHRSKKNRALASARLPVAYGLIAAPILIVGGIGLAWLLSNQFAIALGAYVITTLAYSLKFKRTPLLDVFMLAALYTLRLIMGTAVIDDPFSLWLLTFSMFFFFSLSMAKRHVEVASPSAQPGKHIRGRGYFPEDAPLTLSLGIGSACASILILVLYLVDEAYTQQAYGAPALLFGAPVIIGIWTARIWLLAHRGVLDDDPVAFAVRDRVSLLLGCALFALMAAAILL